MNHNKIAVYDYETDGINPEECSPVQIAAVILDPRTLEYIPGAEFNSMMRPPDFDDPFYYQNHKSTIEWHAKLRGIPSSEVLALWSVAPSQKSVWEQYSSFLAKYNKNPAKPTEFGAPIAAGYNIIGFDNIICNRLKVVHKTKFLYNRVNKFDLMDLLHSWFENSPEVEKMSLDYLRGYLGMTGVSIANAHDALQDVRDTAQILIRLLKLQRHLGQKVQFKDSFNRK